MTQARQRFTSLPAAQQAGILCNDAQFRRFAAARAGFADTDFTASAAAEFLRNHCQIASRTELRHDNAARQRFEALRSEFDAWRGRIGTPNEGPQ